MRLDKACDAMITGYPRSQEEDTHSTDERIDVTNPRPPIPAVTVGYYDEEVSNGYRILTDDRGQVNE